MYTQATRLKEVEMCAPTQAQHTAVSFSVNGQCVYAETLFRQVQAFLVWIVPFLMFENKIQFLK